MATFTSWLPILTSGVVAVGHRQAVVLLHLDGLVVLDIDGLVLLHRDDAAVVDLQCLVVLDVGGQVLLGLQVDEFAALLVVEGELVEVRCAALQAGAGAEAGLGLVGLAVDRRVAAVVEAADDDRPVRIAIDEGDRDLGADAGNELRAPALAGPGLDDARPDRLRRRSLRRGGPNRTEPSPARGRRCRSPRRRVRGRVAAWMPSIRGRGRDHRLTPVHRGGKHGEPIDVARRHILVEHGIVVNLVNDAADDISVVVWSRRRLAL